MSIVKFLMSKTFLKQIGLALLVILILSFLMLKWLKITTNHGDFETVPELKGKSIDVAKIDLEDNNLVLQILDSSNFNPNYPKYSVIDQDPKFGAQVKENRKIYVTLNPSGFRKIKMPKFSQPTFREAKPKLEALGFTIGKITYVDNIAEDRVLEMRYNGKKIKEGDKIAKTSKIDLVLGNGKRASSN